jgi:hypothetical protein
MTTGPAMPFLRLITGCSIALLVVAGIGSAIAEPLHGTGSSHNPIEYHPKHGAGSSHNPIVVSTSKYPPGTVVRDHRNGKNCQYTVGDCRSMLLYNKCEYGYSGGRC